MEKIRQWYVVYTKTGHEQKVCTTLQRKKIDSFYLANKMTKLSYGRERISFKPLVGRYVFAYLSEEEISTAKEASGIINFVHWQAQPVVINADDIYLLRRFFSIHNDIRLEKTKVNMDEQATMSILPSDNDNSNIVNLYFPVLGYIMTVQENKTRVKVITVSPNKTRTNFINKYAQAR